MTDHPLTEARAQALWDKQEDDSGFRWNDLFHDQPTALAAMRASYDAGREDALNPLDPLADLTPGTVIRDVTVVGFKGDGDAFILGDANGPYVGMAHGFCSMPFLTAFTTDDRTTRYTRNGGTWTAETLNGETNE